MTAEIPLRDYRLDLVNECLKHRDAAISLTPKAFAVLKHLATHPGRLVTKRELLQEHWPDVIVGDAVLKTVMNEIRKALADDAKAPRFIETMHRRGYRMIADAVGKTSDLAAPTTPKTALRPESPEPSAPIPPSAPIGRSGALATLRDRWSLGAASRCRMVFVAGEPGIGKTTVVDAFASEIEKSRSVVLLRGQCFESHGQSEPYRPILDALADALRGEQRQKLLPVFLRHAPIWPAQMPWILDDADRDAVKRDAFGSSPDRLARDMRAALALIAAQEPVCILIEDLHWIDPSTLDLLVAIAGSPDRAFVMIVGTFRPVDVILNRHPLRAAREELLRRGAAEEIVLDVLSRDDVAAVCNAAWHADRVADDVVDFLCDRSGGHPLFLTSLIDDMTSSGAVRRTDQGITLAATTVSLETVPETLQDLFESRLARLDPVEIECLEVGAVAGIDFSAGTAACGMNADILETERILEGLARKRLFLERSGKVEWPDGTVSANYRFSHALHRRHLYQRVPAARRHLLHKRIGERGEAVYGRRVKEIAPLLAIHFEEAADIPRAVKYRRMTAMIETERGAAEAAIASCERALELTTRLPIAQQDAARQASLEDLGKIRRGAGDMRGAADAFLINARDPRVSADVKTRNLLFAASALSWFDRDRCLSAVADAEAAAASLTSDLEKSHVRGTAAYWRLLFLGWHADDHRAAMDALADARRLSDPEKIAHHAVRGSFFLLASGDHEGAARLAREGLEKSIVVGAAFDHVIGHFFLAEALILGKRWTDAVPCIAEGLAQAEKSGLQAFFALMCAQNSRVLSAQDRAAEALAESERGLSLARTAHHHLSIVRNLASKAAAQKSLSRPAEASAALAEAEQILSQNRFVMDWLARRSLDR